MSKKIRKQKAYILKKYPGILIGLFITLLSLFFFSLILLIPILIKESYESNNYDEIQKKGITIQATVVDIKKKINITINSENPTIISYRFKLNDKNYFSKYRTLENDKLSFLQINDNINIKYLKGESKIDHLNPFSFSIFPFLFIPLPFLIVGALIIIFSLKPFLAERRAIKFGVYKQGTIVSFFTFSSLPIGNFGKHIIVNYFYFNKDGKKMYGKAKIIDLSILNEKKIGDHIDVLVSKRNELESTIHDI